MKKIPMTAEGYTKLQEELHNFVNKQRPEIIEAIAEARGHGDLSENAEYQFAKEQQSLIEGKISELETIIAYAEIIDISKLKGKEIKFGAIVKIEEEKTKKQSTYQLVGEYESDINNKKISINSPLARSLIGKMKNEVVEVSSPKGTKIYTVISLKYK